MFVERELHVAKARFKGKFKRENNEAKELHRGVMSCLATGRVLSIIMMYQVVFQFLNVMCTVQS